MAVTRRGFLGASAGLAAGLGMAPAREASAALAHGGEHGGYVAWAPPVPGLGFHTALAADPFSAGTLLAGGDVHGLKRTVDQGELWHSIDTGIWKAGAYGISAITPHPEKKGTYYVLSGSGNAGGSPGGVYRSRDRGGSWELLATGIDTIPQAGKGILRVYGRLLALDASGCTDVLYAASYRDGLYKSEDGGATWKVIGFAGDNLTAVVLHPKDPATVLAGWRVDSTDWTKQVGGVQISHDAGRTWVSILDGVAVRDLVIDPNEPGSIYAAALTGGIWRSLDGGTRWQQVNQGLPLTTRAGGPTYFNALEVNPHRPGEVLVGTGVGNAGGEVDGRVYRSRDRGGSWIDLVGTGTVHITDEVIIPSFYYLNGTGMAISAVVVPWWDADAIWASGRSGIWYSRDGGKNWYPRFKGLQGPGLWNDVGINPHTRRLYFGTGDWTLIRSDPAQEVFTGVGLTADFEAPFLRALCFDFTPRRSLLGAGAKYLGVGNYGTVFVEESDLSWRQIGHGLPVRRVVGLRSAPSNPDVVYAALAKTGVFRSTDGAETFTDISAALPGAAGMFPQSFTKPPIAVHPHKPDTVYVLDQISGLYGSTNAGQTWQHLAEGVPVTGTAVNAGAPYQGFDLDPTRPERMFLATSAGLFRSTNAGRTWKQVHIRNTSGFGPIVVLPRTAAVFASALPDTAQAATNKPGIYVSHDGGRTWVGAYVDGPFGVRTFQELTPDPTRPDTVYTATSGGLFRVGRSCGRR